jgi:hypothetical protein
MGKEPLYPHIPGSRQVQFPHRAGGGSNGHFQIKAEARNRRIGLIDSDEFPAMPSWAILNRWLQDLRDKGYQVDEIALTGPNNFSRRVGRLELEDESVFKKLGTIYG